ncbi:putative ribonuclease H-like domain-containing protein [Tanacetum coccineum]
MTCCCEVLIMIYRRLVAAKISSNEDNTANVQVNTASTNVSTTCTNDSIASLSDATIYAFLANQPNGSQVIHKDLEKIHEDDLEEMDLKWQLALLCLKARKFYQGTENAKVLGIKKAGLGNKKAGLGIKKAQKELFMADEEVPTNLALMAFSDSEYDSLRVELNKSEFDLATYKRGLASVEEQLVFYKKNEVMLCDQIAVLKRDASFRDSEINALNIQIEKLKKEKESNQIKIDKFENFSKSLDKLIGSQISNNNRKGVGYNVVPPPPTGLVSKNSSNEIKKTNGAPIIKDWVSDCDEDESEVMESDNVQHKSEPKPEQAKQPRKISENPRNNRTNWNEKKTQKLGVGFQFTKKASFGTGQREVRPVWNNALRTNHQNFSNSRRNFAPTAVLTKSGIIPISTARQRSSRAATQLSAARPINTAAPKLFVTVAKTKPNIFQKAHLLSRRPFNQQTTLINRILNNKVNTAKVNSVNTAKGKRVTSAVGKQGINVVTSSACWVWRPKRNVVDHTSKNSGSYICNNLTMLIQQADSSSSKGGRITGKGKIETGLEDVYCKELKFNLFSVSQMCDKKNSVLFTKTECLILSPDFKLPDENQVMLKIPRKDNMYSFDLKNVVPSKGIENQLNHKVKIIRCDNGTEFKNYDMNQFCGIKGIKREFSNARTPQQNREVDQMLFDIDTLKNSMNYQPVSAGNRTNDNADDVGKKNEVKDSAKEGNMNGPGEATNTDSTNRLNNVSSPVNTVSSSFTTVDPGRAKEQRNEYESLFDPLIPDLEDIADLQDTRIFGSAYDDEYVGAEADLSNLETNMSVSVKPKF